MRLRAPGGELLEKEGKGGERIRVVNSQSTAGGMGLIVLGAARAAQRGEPTPTPSPRARRRLRESLKMWFAVDTLEFLKRSGRIGAASAWIGSTLKIKPILTLEQEITPIERVRTSGRAFERHGRLRARSATRRAPTAGSCSTSSRATRPSGLRSAAARSSRATRSSCPRSGRCSACTRVPGLLGVGGVPPSLLA